MKFPDELNEYERPPSSYRRSRDLERLNMVPEQCIYYVLLSIAIKILPNKSDKILPLE
ncbi:MAG: hypothetical protein HYR97_04030 [Candidatus Melainabacteria bacterium]|nr:hypothetical protein [Candidatus Melainabacteria bacterium]MBI3309507.1 hypothetical protein [Candidatus Melainabacteria bacterium]